MREATEREEKVLREGTRAAAAMAGVLLPLEFLVTNSFEGMVRRIVWFAADKVEKHW